MKAEELMIGDWVQNPLGAPYQVLAIHFYKINGDGDGYYGIHLKNKGAEARLEIYDLHPVPLTPEILEKNGFHWGITATEEDFCAAVGCGNPESGWCFDEGAGEIKILFPNETDGGLVRLDDHNYDRCLEIIFVKPFMVHELQHALRLCGIEKEVVL